MQEFGARQPAEQLSSRETDRRPGPAAASRPAEAPAASVEPQSAIDVSALQNILAILDEGQMQEVLARVPAHLLARALELLLRPPGTAPAVPPQVPAPDDPAEQRDAERSKTLRGGRIVFNGNTSVVDCQIRDMSDSGCRVAVESTAGIPNNFTLHILNSDITHPCQVAWRKADLMGLRFTG